MKAGRRREEHAHIAPSTIRIRFTASASAAGGAGTGSSRGPSAACSSVGVSTRGAGRTLDVLSLLSEGQQLGISSSSPSLLHCRRLLQQRKRRPSHPPPPTSAQPHLSHNPDPFQPAPTPFTYRYRTSHSQSFITPMHDPMQVREYQHPSSTLTPTPGLRTDAALSVSVCGWGAVRGRGRAGGGGRQGC